ncbi:MAG: sensor histidine kinase [Bacteroidota bacterium]
MNNFFNRILPLLANRYVVLAFALLCIFFSEWLFNTGFVKTNPEIISGKIESVLDERHKLTEEIRGGLEEILLDEKETDKFKKTNLLFKSLRSDAPVSFIIFKNNIPVSWSDNATPCDSCFADRYKNESVVLLENGWYELDKKKLKNDFLIVSLILIKHEYQNRNKYLVNSFAPDFDLPDEAKMVMDESKEGIKITGHNGQYLFTVQLGEKSEKSKSSLWILAVLVTTGFILLIYFLKAECDQISRYAGPFYASFLHVITILVLRYWTLDVEFPSVYHEMELFDPALFGSSFILPSLGDFLINSILFLYLFYYLSSRSSRYYFRLEKNKWLSAVVIAFVFLASAVYAGYIGTLIEELIVNSSIEFNVNNIFILSGYSFVGFIIVGILFFSYYLFCEYFLKIAHRIFPFRWYFLGMVLGLMSLVILWNHINGVKDLIIVLWPTAIFLVLFHAFYFKKQGISFNHTILILLIFSFYSAHVLSKFSSAKEAVKRLEIAELRLATDQDLNLETSYSGMESKLLMSKLLKSVFDSTGAFSKATFEEKLDEEFFKGDWNKFDIRVYLFGADSSALGVEGFAPIKDFDEIDNIVLRDGTPSQFSGNLYFIYNSKDKLSYVIKLPVYENENIKGFLFCELRSKKVPEDIGFPELLIDKNNTKSDFIYQYSYARYVDNIQVNHFGNYRYSLNGKMYSDTPGKYSYVNENGYNHLVYKVDERTILVLSKPLEEFISKATSFSYLFTLYCLVLIAGFVLRQLSLGKTTLHLTMQGKIQFLLAGVLLVSLVLFVIGTRYFITDQYNEKNYRIISEKIQSVKLEVTHKIGQEKELNEDLKNFTSYILTKLSMVFLTDINIYKPNGKLFSSSRPKIFQAGLLSEQVNPDAYMKMRYDNMGEFVHVEKIGNMEYLSAYVPLFNHDHQLLGYLNLPYFAKQNALETELSGFLVAIINIFVLLFALSLLGALFVSSWITKPLRLVQKSIASVQLGKMNEPIQYSGSDEIGALVSEYNRKVEELEKYTRELAKTERESAWREMAKQVAHEIKNPLTPMRLSIQHMQRSLHPDDVDFQEKVNRLANTLIEQIDALTNIANEFSNFAKMPKAAEEKINLYSVLKSTVELYENTPGIQLRFSSVKAENANVFCDKDQVLRVFSNLIKNAFQAIPEGKPGKVDVILKKQGKNFLVEVKDNGVGITPDKMDKIFVPNFTTKSTGMGLGLAMVKNIVENAGGKIWFETSTQSGTSFFVSLPEYEEIK